MLGTHGSPCRADGARVIDRRLDHLSTHHTTDADLFHQSLHRAARQIKALTLQLMPRLADPVDLIILIPAPLDL